MAEELSLAKAMAIVTSRGPSQAAPDEAPRPRSFAEWPKVMYHHRREPRVFQNEEEYLRCEVSGWSEKPVPRIPLGMRRAEWEALMNPKGVMSSGEVDEKEAQEDQGREEVTR